MRYCFITRDNNMRLILKVLTVLSIISLSTSCEAQEIENLMDNGDKREMTRLVNQARQKGVYCGGKWQKPVATIKWDDKLEKAASNKSYDMYENKYFAHSSPDGENLSDRLKTINYAWKTIGENLAMGPTSVKQTVDGWLKSEGHCLNIMKPEYTHFGASQYGTYWTQVFAKPKNIP